MMIAVARLRGDRRRSRARSSRSSACPSFVVTLGGFLIWQGVILNKLEQRGTIIIQDRWINYTDATSSRTAPAGSIAAIITVLYPISILYKRVVARGTQIAQQNWTIVAVKARRDRDRRVRHGRDREPRQGHHARREGLPLVGRDHRLLLHRADVPREVDDVRPPRLRRRRQRRGGAPRRHQRAADPRARLHDLGRDGRRSAGSSSPRR